MTSVLITSIPPGEAPETVLAAWIGTILPVAGNQVSAKLFNVVGVLTGPHTYSQLLKRVLSLKYRTEKMEGFAVEVLQAIPILEKQAPIAALWWCQTLPHILRPGQVLIFPNSCCEIVEDG